MKTQILSIILCALTLNASAWQTFPEATKDKSEKEIETIKSSNDGKFYIAMDHEGPGISLVGFNGEEHSIVTIRKINNKYNVKLILNQVLWKQSGDLYIRFLDKEGFEIVDLFMGEVNCNFTGTLYYNQEAKWPEFYDVWSFEVHQKG